jgi:hypothetical protein
MSQPDEPHAARREINRLSLARVQLVERALQLFKLLSSLAELAFRRQALVVGKVFGGFRDERVEIRCRAGATRRMPARLAPAPRGLPRRSSSMRWQSATRPLRQKGPPSPTRRSVRTPADPAARARPDATPASDCARPAGKSAPHTTAPARSESPAGPRAARASLADSTASIVRKAARSDRFAPRFAAVRRPAWFWESCRPPTYRIVRRRCARQSSQSDYSGWPGVKGRISANSTPVSPGSFISTKFGCIACVVCSPPSLMPTSVATVHRSSRL